MEHSCHRCRAAVEDGVAFCPHCNAPQIRVSGLAERAATPPLLPGTPGDVQPPAQPIPFGADSGAEAAPRQVQWALALPGAALAGFLLALSLVIPLASPLLLIIAAGAVSAALYAYRSGGRLSARAGARVGAVGGLLGFVILAFLMALQVALGGGRVVALLREAIQDQIARNPSPQAQQILDKLTSPGGLAVVVGFGMVIFLGCVLACSALGGAIAGALFGRKNKGSGPIG